MNELDVDNFQQMACFYCKNIVTLQGALQHTLAKREQFKKISDIA